MISHAESVLRLATYFKTKLDNVSVALDSEAAEKQLRADEFAEACELYKTDSRNQWYPKNIQTLIDLIRKPIFDDDRAQNIVSKIFEYQLKKGKPWKDGVLGSDQVRYWEGLDHKAEPCLHYTFDQAMHSVFGPVGLEIIRRENGWVNFCQNNADFDKTILRPQLVKLATSLIKHLEKTGSFEVAPSLASGGPVSGNLLDFKIKTIQTTERK